MRLRIHLTTIFQPFIVRIMKTTSRLKLKVKDDPNRIRLRIALQQYERRPGKKRTQYYEIGSVLFEASPGFAPEPIIAAIEEALRSC